MDPIVVTGLPRSGTSWVAKTLSFAAGYTYYREPDNFDHVPGAIPAFRWQYLTTASEGGPLGAHLLRSLRGEERHPSVMAEAPGPVLGRVPAAVRYHLGKRFPSLYRPEPGVLVKLVFSNLALAWMAGAMPAARVVPVLRHPCGTYASWSRLGWRPEPQRLLDDDQLMHDHLAPYEAVIAEADGFWEQAGAEWAALALVLSRQSSEHPEWLVVQHEWLCQDPVVRFSQLFEALELPVPSSAAHFLTANNRPGNDDQRSLQRDARSEMDKWKRTLDPDDVAACRRVVERFELPWYPDFEPVGLHPSWAGPT